MTKLDNEFESVIRRLGSMRKWSGKLRSAIRLAESRLEPDIFAHSMRVATFVGDAQEEDNTAGLKAMVVGVLHDLIEDQEPHENHTWVRFSNLADEFGEEVGEAVEILTRGDVREIVQSYRDYIMYVSTNDLARQVKIADLEDHLSEANASTLKPTLRPRYERALSQLTATMHRDALGHSWRDDYVKRSTLKRLAIQRGTS